MLLSRGLAVITTAQLHSTISGLHAGSNTVRSVSENCDGFSPPAKYLDGNKA